MFITPARILVTFFFSTRTQEDTKKPKVWNVKAVQEQLGSEICNNLLFLLQSLDVILYLVIDSSSFCSDSRCLWLAIDY